MEKKADRCGRSREGAEIGLPVPFLASPTTSLPHWIERISPPASGRPVGAVSSGVF